MILLQILKEDFCNISLMELKPVYKLLKNKNKGNNSNLKKQNLNLILEITVLKMMRNLRKYH